MIKKKDKYIEVNDYNQEDTLSLGGVNDYNNNEIYKFSGIKSRPEILPNSFSLVILDSSKQIIKRWDNKTFNKNIRLNNNQRIIKISYKKGRFIID